MKYRHVEFPNSATRRNRQCQTILSEQVPTIDRFKLKFKLVYPFAGIRQQLMAFYNRLNFENFLQHWLNRTNSDEILSDIYDGQIWKSFKETNDENSPNFFRNEIADSHLGLMINLDWFQPYDGTIHSTGVIYAAIYEMEEMEEISIESEEKSADEFSNIFEDYSSPNYDPDESIDPKSTNNNSYLWILL
ncbi:hypothetical protein Glove_303g21 [Diversispora epigaea]|uniref:Uncharacterized protein n=1 Tax=Diversispora epigaea TaxID=1348612 RepID=A0A397I0Y8_9GLOM|nr:hypothetical protein Glove_303g21 [Diversispora epigaea]